MSVRLKELYTSKLQKQLVSDLSLSNISESPKLEKIIINVGLGRAGDDKRVVEVAKNTLRKITGQEPVVTLARMSIANFKLREGQKNGMKVTLRDERMYEFMDRLISVVLPRLRDFHGVDDKSFDARGNYSIGLKDQTVFPEMNFDDIGILHGLQITFVINNKDPEHSKALLIGFGMPFEKGVSKNAA